MDGLLKTSATDKVKSKGILEIVKPDLANIKSLDLEFCENESNSINKIQPNTFINFSSIEKLSFNSSQLQVNSMFSLKSNVDVIQSVNKLTNLKILCLKNCAIDDISENFYLGSPFVSLVNLNTLDLSSNRISKLNRKCFEGLFELKSLDLSNNQIEDINYSPFEYLESLELLDLSKNQIKILNWHSFGKYLKKLQKLYLSYCPFDFIQYNTFKHLESLNEIHLPWCFINEKSKKFDAYGLKNNCKKQFDSLSNSMQIFIPNPYNIFDYYDDDEYEDSFYHDQSYCDSEICYGSESDMDSSNT